MNLWALHNHRLFTTAALVAALGTVFISLAPKALKASPEPALAVISQFREAKAAERKRLVEEFRDAFVRSTTKSERLMAALALGMFHTELREFELARQYLATANLLCEPNHPLATTITIAWAQLLYSGENYADAAATLAPITQRPLASNHEQDAIGLLIAAHLQLKNYTAAVSFYERYKSAVPLNDRDPDVLLNAAKAYHELGQQNVEISILESLALQYPINPPARTAFERLQQYNDRNSKDTYAFSRALLNHLSQHHNLDPKLKPFLLRQLHQPIRFDNEPVQIPDTARKMQLLLGFKFLQEAKDLLPQLIKEAATLSPKEASLALETLGQAYSALDDQASALKYWELALQKSTSSIVIKRVKNAIAFALYKLGRYGEAANTFAALGRSGGSPARWNYFWNLYRGGRYAKAAKLSDTKGFLKALDPSEPMALYYWRARIAEKMGNMALALPDYRRILRDDASSYYANLVLARHPELNDNRPPPVTTAEFQNPSSPRAGRMLLVSLMDKGGTKTNNPNFQAIEDLFRAGLDNLARKSLRNIKLSQSMANSDLQSVSRLAWAMADYYNTSRMALQFSQAFASVPNELSELNDHQRNFNEEWRLLFPLAYDPMLSNLAQSYNVDKHLLLSIMRAESRYNERARSWVGAVGLMQIMPKTAIRIAEQIKDKEFKVDDLSNPIVNLSYGAYYLRLLLNYYHGNPVLAIAAYNTGPMAVNRWVDQCKNCDADEFVESIGYWETRRYVKKVIRYFSQYSRIYTSHNALQTLPAIGTHSSPDMEIF